jgi:hypothetical protein
LDFDFLLLPLPFPFFPLTIVFSIWACFFLKEYNNLFPHGISEVSDFDVAAFLSQLVVFLGVSGIGV